MGAVVELGGSGWRVQRAPSSAAEMLAMTALSSDDLDRGIVRFNRCVGLTRVRLCVIATPSQPWRIRTDAC